MFFEEIHVGDQIFIPETVVDREEMLQFARRYNPVPAHTDRNMSALPGRGS